MRVVLQRVSRASVSIAGETVGEIGGGLVLLVGFTDGDDGGLPAVDGRQGPGARVFSDEEGKMNLSLEDVEGDLLVVSQFTLYGDTRKGRRPSLCMRRPPEPADSPL